MPSPVMTEVEKRLNEMMAPHENPDRSRYIQERFKDLCMRLQLEGIPLEVLAYSVAQHATACVASLKMARLIRPELADALAEDFVDTLHRAYPGATEVGSKQ